MGRQADTGREETDSRMEVAARGREELRVEEEGGGRVSKGGHDEGSCGFRGRRGCGLGKLR